MTNSASVDYNNKFQ